jgi:hypothetical protein
VVVGCKHQSECHISQFNLLRCSQISVVSFIRQVMYHVLWYHQNYLTSVIVRVHGLTIKFANSSREKCCITHCWISLWSPSKYSPWEAMHRCQRLVHPSRQFWNCHRITPDVISVIKLPSFQYFLYLREQKKVTGGLDLVNRERARSHTHTHTRTHTHTHTRVQYVWLSWKCLVENL